MLRDVLVAVLVLLAAGSFAWRVVAPVGAIWRGDASRVPHLTKLKPQARTYVSFCLWVATMYTGISLVFLDVLADALGIWHRPVLALVGFGAFFATGPLVLLHVFVWAFNRPRILVVPALRDHPGWVRTTLQRMRTRRGRCSIPESPRVGACPDVVGCCRHHLP